MNTDRRTRYARPGSLVFVGIVFLSLPFLNYFNLAYQTRVGPENLFFLLDQTGPVYTVLLLAPFVIGFGLLSVQRWGWWFFVLYSAALIVYGMYSIFAYPAVFNYGAVFRTLLGVAGIVFITRRDISAPYFKMYPRGWRFQKRTPVQSEVLVDGKTMQTNDFTGRGFYVDWPECPYEPGDAVSVQIPGTRETPLQLEGGVVRVDVRGAGIAFRNLTREQKRELRDFVRSS